jgi:hypothetical protein
MFASLKVTLNYVDEETSTFGVKSIAGNVPFDVEKAVTNATG